MLRTISIGALVVASLAWTSGALGQPQRVEAAAAVTVVYPGQVALVQEKEGYVYRRFPSRERLYVYDQDKPSISSCLEGCASRWPPLEAPQDAKAVGAWTPIARADGRQQWAFKGRPVYLRVHDLPDAPNGDGIEGAWHILPPVKQPE
jgi:predicted lipoprotein with Yx(FWY)xxD motif